MINEIVDIFRKNFPFIDREDKTVKHILENKGNKVFEKRDENNKLIGVSVINENVILLLCVDKEYRNCGIGSELLKLSEDYISSQGYKNVKVGAGFDYLMPGVPTNKMVIEEKLKEDNIYNNVDDKAYNFFKNKGYYHSWKDCNCFDMRLDLSDFNIDDFQIGDTLNGITYCWAKIEDLPEVTKCTNDAHENFTEYYKDKKRYREDSKKRVLIAKDGDEIVGTIIVNAGAENNELGSVGCTAVKHSHRGKHIAVNLTKLGTKHLKEVGLPKAYLGYTYSGLDRLYGYAGYKICIYYFMAKKDL